MNEINENSGVLYLFVYDNIRVSDDPVSLWWNLICVISGTSKDETEILYLGDEAIEELQKILSKETCGLASNFTKMELNEIGVFFLTALTERLKMEQ